ncbi:SpoIIE family protein phosphatase [Halanaerobacter jeridensis]|uniref:PAS domain S-box-containing protein n=1 Tax=Halanaerobacter jeridensis TaxID=706427 RepID=A0A939BPC4_9FIRM|nr:SpoIIE family protein phosphatase [Halanaerobacter jeridensis]MBM7556643.1 PAS domain S-box-containing protein [Halanaerobacter jeridensis]
MSSNCNLDLIEYNLEAYINIIKNSPIGICITDKNGFFEYVNPKYCELYGYNKEELLGEHFSLVTTKRNKKKLTDLHDKFINDSTEIEGEWEVIDKEGKHMVILANAAKILGQDCEARKVTYVIDITEKKKFEWELQEKYSELQESTEEIKAMNQELEEKQEEIMKKNQKLNENIAKAKKLHKNLLPKKLPKIDNLDIDVYYKPAQQLGGDFYNLIEIEGYLLFYVVDITGHGIDGALLNVFVRETINSFLHSHSGNNLSSAQILRFLSRKYREEGFPDDYFLCIMLGILNKDTMELTYSNAGIHIPPLLSTAENEISSLTASSLPISSAFDIQSLEIAEDSIKLEPNNSLLVTTDGLIEEVHGEELYGRERLAWLFEEYANLSAQEISQEIKRDFKDFTGDLESQDDITFLIIKYQN